MCLKASYSHYMFNIKMSSLIKLSSNAQVSWQTSRQEHEICSDGYNIQVIIKIIIGADVGLSR